MAKITNNEKAANAFIQKINGKAYTTPEALKADYVASLEENGFTVKRKLTYKSRKQIKLHNRKTQKL